MNTAKNTIALLACLVSSLVTANAQGPALHDGDRVVFYGDSITAQRFYTRFVEDFALTRYPGMRVTFWNAGVPGDTVYGGYTGDTSKRLARDLFPHQPTVVTILLGMNDGYYSPFSQKYLDIFEAGYRDLVKKIQAQDPAARLTLISSTPYDEVTHGTEFPHYSEAVRRNADFAREFAVASHFQFADFDRAVSSLLKEGAGKNSSLAALLVPDRIHPSEAAHWVMAAELARAWGFSPIVSSVRLDAGKGVLVDSQNAQVSEIKAQQDSLAWTQLDNALPLPLELNDGMIQFTLQVSSLAAMDQQILRVDGLRPGRYALKIDKHAIGTFDAGQLESGVNLALYPTPMESQAKEVDGIEMKRTRLDQSNFITAIEDPKVQDEGSITAILNAKDAALADQQRNAAQPKPHQFELLPQ
ncbi:MAG TPA: SGNH/GDSL hydrolase family protein [Terracidiphilus sp.]|nr:SGNH/GDSL hydrolase family protein [Terracidiphilus sp.]